MCSCWHRGCFSPHVSTHELRTCLVNCVADDKWMLWSSFASRAQSLYSILLCSSVVSVQLRCCNILHFLFIQNKVSDRRLPSDTQLSCHVPFKGGPEPSEKLIWKVLFPIGRFHFCFIPVPKQIRPYHRTWYISRTGWSVFRSARRGVTSAPFMVPDLRSPRDLAHLFRNDSV